MYDYMLNPEKYEYGNNVTEKRSRSGLVPNSTLNLPFVNLPYVATK